MKEKKHIDRLFQEKFKDFDVVPPDSVWSNIEAKLREEKEDRKIIPLWVRIAGIAALLALLFTIGSTFFNSPNASEDGFTNTDTIKTESDLNSENNTIADTDSEEKVENNNTTVASEEKNNEQVEDNTNTIYKNPLNTDSNSSVVSEENKKNTTQKEKINSTYFNNSINTETTVTNSTVKNAIALNETKEDDIISNSENKTTNNLIKTEEELVKDLQKTNAENAVVIKEVTKNETNEDAVNKEEGKIDLIEYLKEKEEEDALTDIDINEEVGPRWKVTPNIAPVYYSSLSNGSSINSEFSDNSKSGETTISYGVQVSYNVSNRLTVRTGLNKIDLSYNTNDIEFAIAPTEADILGVKYNKGNRTYLISDAGKLNERYGSSVSFENGNGIETVSLDVIDGKINQRLSYLEMPVEVSYALLKNKFSINLIGGFSALFLENDELSVVSSSSSDVIGSANNLNTMSFTTNVGIGFNYQISNSLKFNIEPMFKYQLNPYSDNSIDFNPYYLGVYTGLSIQF